MPAKGHATHWRKPSGEAPLLFERGQRVWTASGRLATVTQYWTSPKHEYSGCASIKYEDNGQTAVVKMSLLTAYQPGRQFKPAPTYHIKPIPAPLAQSARPGSAAPAGPNCETCPHRRKPKPAKAARVPDLRQLAFAF